MMTKILMVLAGFCAITASAQTTGTVTYERKINNHRRINDAQVRAMMPEYRTTKHELVYSDSVSVYKTLPEEQDPFDNGSRSTVVFASRFDGGILYKNMATRQVLEEQEFADKTYVVEDSVKQQPWKLTEERKTILGHPCRKAVMTVQRAAGGVRRMVVMGGQTQSDTTSARPQMQPVEIVAWFAEDIHAPVGPGIYGSLPGLILMVDENNGEAVYVATDIKEKIDRKELKEPKGKRITRAELAKKREEAMQNMQMGGGNMIRIGG